eukprot:242488-Pleurochrysis_carterae.AAC.2
MKGSKRGELGGRERERGKMGNGEKRVCWPARLLVERLCEEGERGVAPALSHRAQPVRELVGRLAARDLVDLRRLEELVELALEPERPARPVEQPRRELQHHCAQHQRREQEQRQQHHEEPHLEKVYLRGRKQARLTAHTQSEQREDCTQAGETIHDEAKARLTKNTLKLAGHREP